MNGSKSNYKLWFHCYFGGYLLFSVLAQQGYIYHYYPTGSQCFIIGSAATTIAGSGNTITVDGSTALVGVCSMYTGASAVAGLTCQNVIYSATGCLGNSLIYHQQLIFIYWSQVTIHRNWWSSLCNFGVRIYLHKTLSFLFAYSLFKFSTAQGCKDINAAYCYDDFTTVVSW